MTNRNSSDSSNHLLLLVCRWWFRGVKIETWTHSRYDGGIRIKETDAITIVWNWSRLEQGSFLTSYRAIAVKHVQIKTAYFINRNCTEVLNENKKKSTIILLFGFLLLLFYICWASEMAQPAREKRRGDQRERHLFPEPRQFSLDCFSVGIR